MKDLQKPKYKLGYLSSSGEIDVIIKRKYQTDENFILLAKYIRQRYCQSKRIMLSVFDNKKDAEAFTVYQVKEIPDTLRAMYYLDRESRKEKLARIKVVDNRQVEIIINLSN